MPSPLHGDPAKQRTVCITPRILLPAHWMWRMWDRSRRDIPASLGGELPWCCVWRQWSQVWALIRQNLMLGSAGGHPVMLYRSRWPEEGQVLINKETDSCLAHTGFESTDRHVPVCSLQRSLHLAPGVFLQQLPALLSPMAVTLQSTLEPSPPPDAGTKQGETDK